MRWHLSRLQTAPQFAAVLDCLFDLHPARTRPSFAELAIVDGRLVFARAKGEDSFRHFVGNRDQLTTNLIGLVRHLKLGKQERDYVLGRIDTIARHATR
jgi:hypothetical protein